ncbi:MAG: thiamine phosphate synthase [bacterium]
MTDAERYGVEESLEVIRAAAEAGVEGVQVREKGWDARPLVGFTRRVLETARPWDMRVVINGRLDVALATGAHGVHLGGGALHPEAARELADRLGRADFLVGVSTHSRADVARASAGIADYVLFGPVFATPSKAPYGPPQGLAELEAVCADGWVPVLAVGGVDPANTADVLRAGAAGSACIRALFEAEDPREAARRWVSASSSGEVR